MATTSQGYKVNKHPIAQSFFVDEVSGIFVTKIDLFFKTVDSSFPVQLQLRPMDNGFPSSTEILPGSQVVVPGNSVQSSANATSATTFTFAEPVYLQGLTDYAIVVTADSKDYEIWVAQTNEFLIGSTERRVDRQPVLGSLFYSQNSVTFTAAQNQDLTFKIYKANFSSTSGEAILHNAAVPVQLLNSNPFNTTNASSTVRVEHVNHGLQVAESITIAGAVDTNGITAANLNGSRTITARDYTGYEFTAGGSATSTGSGGGSAVTATKNIPFSVIYPHLQTLLPMNTQLSAGLKATTGKSYAAGNDQSAFQKQSTYNAININQNNVGLAPYIVANTASETSNLGSGVKSLDVGVKMGTGDTNVTPMIDMQRATASLINYCIDRPASVATTGFNTQFNFVDETSASGGSAATKHITKPVTLEQDAVGLKIILSANRPSAADFQVYYRTAAGDEILNEQNYVLLDEETSNPSDENVNVFREYRYIAGGQGGDLTSFTQFQLKIVFRTTNEAKVPVIRDLRTIALSV